MPTTTNVIGASDPNTGLQNISSQTLLENEPNNRFSMIKGEVLKVLDLVVRDCSITKKSKKFPDFYQKLKESNSEYEVINSINSYFKNAASSDKCRLVIKTIRESMEKKDSFLAGGYCFYKSTGNGLSGKHYKLTPLENNENTSRLVAENTPQYFGESKLQYPVGATDKNSERDEDIGQSLHVNVSSVSKENVSQCSVEDTGHISEGGEEISQSPHVNVSSVSKENVSQCSVEDTGQISEGDEDIGQSSHVNVSPISEENISQETNLRSLAELKRDCENHSNEIDLLKADNDIFTALLEIYNGFPAITNRIKLGSQELEKPNDDGYDSWVAYENRLLKDHYFLVSKKEEYNKIVINNSSKSINEIVTDDDHETNVISTQHSISVSSDIISQAIKTIDTKKTIGERFFSFLANVFHHSAYIRRESEKVAVIEKLKKLDGLVSGLSVEDKEQMASIKYVNNAVYFLLSNKIPAKYSFDPLGMLSPDRTAWLKFLNLTGTHQPRQVEPNLTPDSSTAS
ncbi:hypothetical protein [Yersinia aleksiciae]|uniref:Uncharacterized protein n=1 Tax=Yersinia aleksiciae TaxID=263819 RepID=A0ABM5UFD9_YERAE|nr:hypothetical protein [Yersinia aleksiciae]AKP34540.1 hypothetical protein ACZ76_13875 [Yersinia aleksiciae]CFQ44375.1 Uncharacterised protein [Yersinia aleksiciae]